MNLDLYTEEFRNFKFLKSGPYAVNYYKKTAEQLNKVQPWAQVNDPTFTWPCRLEFVEQLLDLTYDTVYLVEPGVLYNINRDKFSYDYEQARLNEIVHPIVYNGHILNPSEGKIAQLSDIPEIEDSYNNNDWYMCSEEYFMADPENIDHPGNIYTFNEHLLVPSDYITYSAMFYDKEWAMKYQDAITYFLRKNNDAISAISKLI
jgi:hypothetical protein